jgi:hypothetical protein
VQGEAGGALGPAGPDTEQDGEEQAPGGGLGEEAGQGLGRQGGRGQQEQQGEAQQEEGQQQEQQQVQGVDALQAGEGAAGGLMKGGVTGDSRRPKRSPPPDPVGGRKGWPPSRF